MQEIFDIAVIGAGAAGQMAVLRSVLNNKSTIVFLGDAKANKKSRARWVSKVVNMPYLADLPRPITAGTKETFEWIQNSEMFSKNFRQEKDSIIEIIKNSDGSFNLKDSQNNSYTSRYVILATGIMDVQPAIQGSIRPVLPYANNGHIDYCMRCDGHNAIGKITAAIGHNMTAAKVAIILHERYNPPAMKIFTNGQELNCDDESKSLIDLYRIKVIKSPIVSIKGDPKTKMEAFELEDGTIEPVEMAFPMLGQIAYNELALQLGATVTEKGNVVCNEKGESSIPGFYVAGDLRDTGKYQIYTAWDQAVDSADDIDMKIRLQKRQQLLVNSLN